jgi:hypothetical protein
MGVSLCPKICTDPTNLIVPDFGDPSYLTGDCYDW